MHTYVLIILLALLTAPAASGASIGCIGSAEAYVCDEEYVDDSCDGHGGDLTRIRVEAIIDYAYFEGGEFCSPGYWSQGMYLNAPLMAAGWSEARSDQGYECTMHVDSFASIQRECVVAPPNPGWGTLP